MNLSSRWLNIWSCTRFTTFDFSLYKLMLFFFIILNINQINPPWLVSWLSVVMAMNYKLQNIYVSEYLKSCKWLPVVLLNGTICFPISYRFSTAKISHSICQTKIHHSIDACIDIFSSYYHYSVFLKLAWFPVGNILNFHHVFFTSSVELQFNSNALFISSERVAISLVMMCWI
jgi:hypothetical protein